jgi:hypothetical protein
MATDRAIAQAWRELAPTATRHMRADEFGSAVQQRAAELDATPPAGAGEAVLPAAAEPITERAVGLPTVAVGDWIIPTGAGSCRVVDARMAYGWNQCREEVRERLAKSAAPTPLPEAVREIADEIARWEEVGPIASDDTVSVPAATLHQWAAALRAIPAQAQRKENDDV